MSDLRAFVTGKDDRVYESVTVPEWDNREVWLRSPDSKDRDAFEASLIVTKKKRKPNGKVKTDRETQLVNIRAKLVVMCVCEGKGEPKLVFTPADAEMLGSKNAAALDRLYEVAQRLSGVTDDDVEEIVGN